MNARITRLGLLLVKEHGYPIFMMLTLKKNTAKTLFSTKRYFCKNLVYNILSFISLELFNIVKLSYAASFSIKIRFYEI